MIHTANFQESSAPVRPEPAGQSRAPTPPGSGVLNRYSAEAESARAQVGRVLNSCHRCGATAYKSLMARDDTGVMRPSGLYQCVQCRQVFRDVRAWRDGIST